MDNAQRQATLYHYTSQPGFLGITASKSVWASKIHYMNDGSEFGLSVDLVRQYVAEQSISADTRERLALQALANIAGNVAESNVCVASFTEEGDLLSQWRGYCSPGDGVSIGFPTSCVQSSVQSVGWRLVRCTYDSAEQRELLGELVDRHRTRLLEWLSSLTDPPSDSDDHALFREAWPFAQELAQIAPGIKHPSFSEEREWRAVSPAQDFRRMHYRPGRHTLIPYTELPILNMQNEPVRVLIGPTAYPELAKGAAGGRLMQQGFTDYEVVGSTVPFRDW